MKKILTELTSVCYLTEVTFTDQYINNVNSIVKGMCLNRTPPDNLPVLSYKIHRNNYH